MKEEVGAQVLTRSARSAAVDIGAHMDVGLLDQLATHADKQLALQRATKPGAVLIGSACMEVMSKELEGIPPEHIGATLLILSSLGASMIDDGMTVNGLVNMAAITGAHFYLGKELQ